MAMETPKIIADIIEAQEFPYLSRQYGVRAVPKTIINNMIEIMGSVPEEVLLHRIISASGQESLLKEIDEAAAQGISGGPVTRL